MSKLDSLPDELRLTILSHIEGQKLHSVILINKAWYALAIDKLWATPPRKAFEHLNALRSAKSRRQFYASKVTSLTLCDPGLTFEALKFTSIRSLSFGRGAGPENIKHASFIQPLLVQLSYGDEHAFTAESLDLVRQRCPNLRSLQVYTQISFESRLFIELLQSCQHLTSIHLGHQFDSRVVEDFLISLAGPMSSRLEELVIHTSLEHNDPSHIAHFLRTASVLRRLTLDKLPSDTNSLLSAINGLNMLEELDISHWLTTEGTSLLLQQYLGLPLFQNVQMLSLEGDAQVVLSFLSSRSITWLDLEVQDPNKGFFAAIGSMTQLISLEISCPSSEILLREHLESLRSLSNLRRLMIAKRDWDFLDGMLQLPWMTDMLFEEFIVNFPLLETLNLYWDLADDQVSEVSIDALARCCPGLERTMLVWTHNLKDWQTLKAPLFPKLTFLGLGDIHEFAGRR
jgi:hypothetical protein